MSLDPNSVGDSPEDEPVKSNIRTLPDNASKFEANGKMYFIEDDIALGRYKHFNKMEIELGFNVNFSSLVESISSAYTAINEMRPADAAVILMKILERSVSIAEKKPISEYVATLFINTPDEDPSEWSLPKAEQKLEDWKGIDAGFFLGVCLARMRNAGKRYNEIADLIESVNETRAKARKVIEG